MSLDDLIKQKEEKKKGGLDALIQSRASSPQAGLDALIEQKSTGAAVSLLPSPPSPGFMANPPQPTSFPEIGKQVQQVETSKQEKERELLRAAGQIDSEVLANKVKSGQPLTDIERRAWQEQSGQAIPTKELETAAVIGTSLLFPPITAGPAFLGTVGRTALGSGTVAGLENVAIDTGAGIAERKLPTLGELAMSFGTGFVFGGLAGGASSKFLGKTGDEVTFGRKVKDIADNYGISPSQANKYLKEMSEKLGTDRGTIADGVIGHAVKTQPEGPQAFAKYMGDVAENADEILNKTNKTLADIVAEARGISADEVLEAAAREAAEKGETPGTVLLRWSGKELGMDDLGAVGKAADNTDEVVVPPRGDGTMKSADEILPADFNAESLVKELDPYQTPRVTPERTLKNVNLNVMDDEQLSRFIDTAVKQSPEFQIPNDVVGYDVLRRRADALGSSALDDYLKDVNPNALTTPEGQIRRIATEVLAATDILKNHMDSTTIPLARKVGTGEAALDEFRQSLVTDLRLFRKIGGVKSEYGRGLGAGNIKATGEMGMYQRFMRDVNKVVDKDANLDLIAKRISQLDLFDPTARQLFLRDLVHATTWEKIDEIFYNSILSGIVTQGRNILGNTGTIIMRELERPFAITAENISALIHGRARQRHFRESLHAVYGIFEGTREGIHAGWKAFQTEVPQYGIEGSIMSDLSRTRRIGGAIKGPAGRAIRIPGRALMGVDEFFKGIAKRMETNAQAYNAARLQAKAQNLNSEQLLDVYNHLRYNPTDDMLKKVDKEVLIRTFQTPTGEIGQGLTRARDAVPGLKYYMPFVRTPLNIMEFGADRIPGVNLVSILNRSRQGIPIDWTDEFTKTAVGTMIASGIYLAHQQGLINGFGPKQRTSAEKAFLTSGRQRYAFTIPDAVPGIGGTSISFSNFEPFDTILGFAADTFDAIDSGIPVISEDMAINIGRALGRNFTEKSYGMGLDSFLSLMTGDYEKAKYGAGRTVSGFIPFSSLTRNIATTVDPTLRRTVTPDDNIGDVVLNSIKGNIPGLRSGLEPVLDIWGREVVTEGGVMQRMAAVAGGDVSIPGDLIRMRELSEDPATKEVYKLMQQFPEEPFEGLSSPRREISGVDLTSEEYVAYVKESGQLAHRGVTEFINKPFYKSMPPEKQKKHIEKIIKKAREQARNEFRKERGIKNPRSGSPGFF